MTIAYWCIFISALLPYLWVSIAKGSGERYNNHTPREWQAKQTNPRSVRAHAAHLNGFESFPVFVAGVLMAQAVGIAPTMISTLAIIYTVARIFHGVFYVADKPPLRSLAWLVGFLAALALILLAALRVT